MFCLRGSFCCVVRKNFGFKLYWLYSISEETNTKICIDSVLLCCQWSAKCQGMLSLGLGLLKVRILRCVVESNHLISWLLKMQQLICKLVVLKFIRLIVVWAFDQTNACKLLHYV